MKTPSTDARRNPANPGDLLRRLLTLTEATLETLEKSAEEFRGRGILPSKQTDDMLKLAASLDKTTLAWTRFKKAEADWADKQTPEERFVWLGDYCLSMIRERPDLVKDFIFRVSSELAKTEAWSRPGAETRARKIEDTENEADFRESAGIDG